MGTTFANRRYKNPVRVFTLLSLSFSIFLIGVLGAGTDTSTLNIGYSTNSFVSVPKEDLKIAVRLLTDKVAKRTVGPAESNIYESGTEIGRALKNNSMDVAALTSEEFIDLRGSSNLEPAMVTVIGKTPEVELLLLTRKDSGINRIREIKGRTLAIPSNSTQFGFLNRIWLEILSMKETAETNEKLFSAIKETRSASQAVMAVFFHKAEACIVNRNSFEIASELNPQLAKDLKVIANVGHLAGGIVALRRDLPPERKQRVRSALKTLHEDTDGKQMFVLFQLTRLEEFRPELLKGTEELLAEHRELKKRFTYRH